MKLIYKRRLESAGNIVWMGRQQMYIVVFLWWFATS